MKKHYKTLEQVWADIDSGKTIHCGSDAYAITIEPVATKWRLLHHVELPFSTRGEKCLRVTCTSNYFGSLLTPNDLGNLYSYA